MHEQGEIDYNGIPAVAIPARTVEWAVSALGELDRTSLLAIKIRSGEHLAAILTTAFVKARPTEVDTRGGVDLVFQLGEERYLPDLIPAGSIVAFEIKSMPGPYREYETLIERGDLSLATHSGIEVEVRTAEAVFEKAMPLLERAAQKLSGLDVNKRYVFLVIHPFDELAIEVARSYLAAHELPPLNVTGVDGVWVLWVPDQLTVWSTAENVWHQMLFTGMDSNEPDRYDNDLAFLQEMELRFLELTGHVGGTPYLFGLSNTSGHGPRPDNDLT